MNFSDWERERKGLFVTDKNGDGGAKSRLQVAVKPPLPLFYTSKILENWAKPKTQEYPRLVFGTVCNSLALSFHSLFCDPLLKIQTFQVLLFVGILQRLKTNTFPSKPSQIFLHLEHSQGLFGYIQCRLGYPFTWRFYCALILFTLWSKYLYKRRHHREGSTAEKNGWIWTFTL